MAKYRRCYKVITILSVALLLAMPASMMSEELPREDRPMQSPGYNLIKSGIVNLSCPQNSSVIKAGASHTYQINVTNTGLTTDTINLTFNNPTNWRAHFNDNDPLDMAPEPGISMGRAPSYRNYSSCVAEIYTIEATHPDIVNVTVIGTSWEGRDIHLIKVSDNVTVDETEPEVCIMGMHHAREWMTVEVVMHYLNHLVDNYGSDGRATWMVNNREIFLVPIVNPDGYVFSQEVQNMWRKNRRDNGDGTFGVDPNRNYNGSQNGDPVGEWGGVGSSHSTNAEDYCGPSAFSEPENQAIRDLIISRDFRITLSYHSFGREIYWPWGYSTGVQTPDDFYQKAIAQNMSSINGYTPMQSAAAYPTTGDSDDWIYGYSYYVLGRQTWPFTIELDTSFQPPASRIPLTCGLNLDVNYYATETAGNLFLDSPTLTHTPLEDTTNTTGPYTVSVNITTTLGLLPGATKLFWKTSGSWNEEVMTNVGGETWEADIPGLVDTWVGYYVVTEDINFNKASEPKYIPYAYHLFHVGADETEYSVTLGPSEWEIVNFVVEAPATALPDEEAVIDVIGTSQNTPSESDSVETVTEVMPGIVLIDDRVSGVADYQTALDNNDFIYDEGKPGTINLLNYPIVIWATEGTSPLDWVERSNIEFYLNAGGNLFIIGEDLGKSAQAEGWMGWYNSVLHASYINDDSNAITVNGIPGDEITDGMTNYIITGEYPSEISPYDASASTIFTYNKTGNPTGAIKADTGSYKVVYIAFEYFEGFPGDQQAHKDLLMYRIVKWLTPGDSFNIVMTAAPGWNLISLPLIQNDESIDEVLGNIDGKWNCIQTYDTVTLTWNSNATSRPDVLNDLASLNHSVGFWINITEPGVELTIQGQIPNSTSIQLYAGWNLVGYPTLNDSTTVADAFWGTGADSVEVFDPVEPYRIKEVGPTYIMKPGEGYWVHVPFDAIWFIDW